VLVRQEDPLRDRLRREPLSKVTSLLALNLVVLPGPFAIPEDAFAAAATVLDAGAADAGDPPLEVIGDFQIPPLDGGPSRDFQTLHFDFGLPLDPVRPADVARYTALHIPLEAPASGAITRFVPLAPLLGQIGWAERGELLARFSAYGRSHGAWDDDLGYSEGSLARVVEAAGGAAARLPSVKADPDFLCGNEFIDLTAELRFLEGHGLSVEAVQRDVTIEPGEALIFDNLAFAHGREGRRNPGELRQRVFGHRSLGVEHQRALRERFLDAFHSSTR
jgi:hypothetical protein